MLKYILIIFFAINSVLLYPAHFKLATISTKDSMDYIKLSLFMNELFKRTGNSVELVSLPGIRALNAANIGIVDGDAARTKIAVLNYKNVILVPFSYTTIKISAYSINENIKKVSAANLNEYSIIYIRGTKYIESLVENISPKKLNITSNADSAVKMLFSGRGDILLGIDYNIDGTLKKFNSKKAVFKIKPPIAEVPLFIVLNSIHSEFAHKLALEMEQMKKDGSLEKLMKKGSLSSMVGLRNSMHN